MTHPKRWFQNRQIRFDGSGGLSSSIEIMVLSAEANTEADIDAFLLRKLNRPDLLAVEDRSMEKMERYAILLTVTGG